MALWSANDARVEEEAGMRLAILGTGSVGSTLGPRWSALGHEVCFGSRDPRSAKARALVQAVGGARVANLREAVVGAEVIVLATPADAHGAVLRAVGDLEGRIVIDA